MKVEKVRIRGKWYLAFDLVNGRLLLPIVGETRQGWVVYNPALGGNVVFPKQNQ